MHAHRLTQLSSLTLLAAPAAILLAACVGISFSSSTGSASTGSPTFRADVAYAHCMQTHGLPSFPDPNPSESFHVSEQPNANSPTARANDACLHLLPCANVTAQATPSSPGAVAADCLTLPSPCYTPRQVRVAYGIQPLLDRGITGRKQTVVLLEFPPLPTGSPSAVTGIQVPAVTDIRQDLARFDSVFSLPAARLQVVNTLAHTVSPWLSTIEEVADTEIVHAVAPYAAIREVLIPSSYVASPGTVSAAVVAAVRLGLTQGAVISLSAGAGEQCFTPAEVSHVNSALQAAQRAA